MWVDEIGHSSYRTQYFTEDDCDLLNAFIRDHPDATLFGLRREGTDWKSRKRVAASLEEIRKERGAYYGDAKKNHESIGQMWTGLINQYYSGAGFDFKLPVPIPGELVAMCQVLVKLNRQAFRRKKDNIDDAKNYIDIAEEVSNREV